MWGRGYNPLIFPSSLALRMSLLKPSIRITKRKGDNGSPCLIPREGENWLAGETLNRIENLVYLINTKIHLIHGLEKPKAFKMASR